MATREQIEAYAAKTYNPRRGKFLTELAALETNFGAVTDSGGPAKGFMQIQPAAWADAVKHAQSVGAPTPKLRGKKYTYEEIMHGHEALTDSIEISMWVASNYIGAVDRWQTNTYNTRHGTNHQSLEQAVGGDHAVLLNALAYKDGWRASSALVNDTGQVDFNLATQVYEGRDKSKDNAGHGLAYALHTLDGVNPGAAAQLLTPSELEVMETLAVGNLPNYRANDVFGKVRAQMQQRTDAQATVEAANVAASPNIFSDEQNQQMLDNANALGDATNQATRGEDGGSLFNGSAAATQTPSTLVPPDGGADISTSQPRAALEAQPIDTHLVAPVDGLVAAVEADPLANPVQEPRTAFDDFADELDRLNQVQLAQDVLRYTPESRLDTQGGLLRTSANQLPDFQNDTTRQAQRVDSNLSSNDTAFTQQGLRDATRDNSRLINQAFRTTQGTAFNGIESLAAARSLPSLDPDGSLAAVRGQIRQRMVDRLLS